MIKWALGIALATVFTISMVLVPAFAGGHLIVTDLNVKDSGSVSKVTITTFASIEDAIGAPRAFGFGVIGEDGRILVSVTHPGVGLDSVALKDIDDDKMHTHVITLDNVKVCKDKTANKKGLVIGTIDEPVLSGISHVDGKQLTITAIPDSAAGKLSNVAASFTLSVADGRVCVDNLKIFDFS